MRNLIPILLAVVVLCGCGQEPKPIITGEPDLIEVDWYLEGYTKRHFNCFVPIYLEKAKGIAFKYTHDGGVVNVALPEEKLSYSSGSIFISDLLCTQPDSGIVTLWEKIELHIKDNYVVLSNKNQKVKQHLSDNSKYEILYQTKSD